MILCVAFFWVGAADVLYPHSPLPFYFSLKCVMFDTHSVAEAKNFVSQVMCA